MQLQKIAVKGANSFRLDSPRLGIYETGKTCK